MRRCFILSLAGLVLPLLTYLGWPNVGGEEPDGSNPPSLSQTPSLVEHVLQWLPADTQTVIVDQTQSKLLEAFGRGPGEGGIYISTWPPSMVHGAQPSRLAGQSVKLVVEGSRRFRAPTGLGLMPYEGAMIAVFDHDLDDGTARSLHDGASQTETILGRKVSIFRTHIEKDDLTIYVALPTPSVLISATNRGYLVDLLGRMEKHAGPRSLPDSLPEWKYLEPKALFWGVRHYDTRDAEFDPTSPLGAWAVRDDQAVGFVFAYDRWKHEARVSYLSNSKDASHAFSKFWNPGTKPEVRELEGGIIELSVTLKQSQDDPGEADMFFRLSAALGHALCL
jgi:hypothetical protein